MRLNIQLPQGIQELTEEQKRAVIRELAHAMKSTMTEELSKALNITPLAPKPVDKEHSIWNRNDDPLLADAEEALYEALVIPSMDAMAEVLGALGLSYEAIEKSLTEEFMEYEDQLIKGKGKRDKVSDLMELSKKKKQDFLKYIEGAGNWSKKKLAEIDKLLSAKLPNYAQIAEDFARRAGLIAKAKNKADSEALEATGALVDRFLTTIEPTKHEDVVLTQEQKDKLAPKPVPVEPSLTVTAEELEEARKNWKKTKVLPLQPQETRAVENAELRTGEKIQEVNDRYRASIKQLVLQAINGRWSSQQLAQKLFDKFGELNRDWRRIAITELAMATTDAFIAGCEEGEQVWVPPVEGSCKHCKQYLEGKTFTVTHDPSKFGRTHEQEMKYVWVGKSNYGRTVATWIPCIPLHPNCRHRFTKLSRFYNVENGKPVLKDVKQLIQEERARRGLPPDPNL